jgi:hypothetical protein
MQASTLRDVSSAFRQHIIQYLVLYHLLLKKNNEVYKTFICFVNPLNPELNPIC